MQWPDECGKVGAIFRPPAEKLHLPRLTMDWAFPMNGRPDGLGVPDGWAFPFNGRSENRASVSGKVGAICRLPVANCTSRILR